MWSLNLDLKKIHFYPTIFNCSLLLFKTAQKRQQDVPAKVFIVQEDTNSNRKFSIFLSYLTNASIRNSGKCNLKKPTESQEGVNISW